MPELPEVETTARGVAPHVEGARIEAVVVRDHRLRWPIPATLPDWAGGQRIMSVRRRAKYLLFTLEQGTLIIHLGMSGSLRIGSLSTPAEKHDHFDLVFENCVLRYRDPRRFGMLDFTEAPPETHRLLRGLGPEPFTTQFDGRWLHGLARGRRCAVKPFIMDASVVTGVGNIYANEALFRARIHPNRAAGRISLARYEALSGHIKAVLTEAIAAGGTTLRDFVSETGRPGYFRTQLDVYDRAGEPCRCGAATIRQATIGQRSSFFCPCQR